jgi:DNA repair protein RecN (Recombination protein N)
VESTDLRNAGLKVTLPRLKILEILEKSATRSAVEALGDKSRVEELARMLGGVEITRETRANAKQMLASAQVA